MDTLFHGKLRIIQAKRGYRFSLDAVLLAHFATLRGSDRVVDLGTGNGVIPLILARLHPAVEIVGVELQEEMARRALRNVNLNRLEERVKILRGDVCSVEEVLPPESVAAVVCNPPYRRPASGRVNPDAEKRIARHEIKARLADFIRAGSYLLRRGGHMALVYPAARMVDLLQTMRQEEIEPKRLRLVHSYEGSAATLALAEGIKGAGTELRILPPLVVYTRDRKYTREMKAVLGE
ncbi:MAG: tRNA1(Val) (adenine(37)-N6)-methyltransferase [Deltaproteobacteria bacterium]|nr:tRNA1(Val) (adenine(37)-N6)-methyltransferase [Deltaproteobacteria bacterium]MBI2209380.1 tRNA1(Val) (adenine(37)-N6)-methyltransferase [Deltaproteobacteria bacterium]